MLEKPIAILVLDILHPWIQYFQLRLHPWRIIPGFYPQSFTGIFVLEIRIFGIFLVFFWLSHQSKGLAKNVCQRSWVELLLVALELSNFPTFPIEFELPLYKATGEGEFFSTKFSCWITTYVIQLWGCTDQIYSKLCRKIWELKAQKQPCSKSTASHLHLQLYLTPGDQEHISGDLSPRADELYVPVHPRLSYWSK